MDSTVAAETESAALPVTVVPASVPGKDAEMVLLPTARALTMPLAPELLPTVATAALEEDQVAEVVTSLVDPSEKAACAVTCWLFPFASDRLAGVMESETSRTDPELEFPRAPPPHAVRNARARDGRSRRSHN